MSKNKVFVVSFDTAGFEAIVDLTDWYLESSMDVLRNGQLKKPPVSLQALEMRARFNPHRNPEVWILHTTEDFTEDSLREVAEENPQLLADLIREKGKPVYQNKGYTGNVIQ